jgi:hypothetical protein
LEACGGNAVNSTELRRPAISDDILLDVYEFESTTKTSSSTETSSTTSTSSPPDISSDPDPEPEKRNIHADMEISQRKTRRNVQLRRGGLLKNPSKAVEGRGLVKRDNGLKQLFVL